MTQQEKDKIKSIFYNFMIKDPYPEITQKEILGIKKDNLVSAHKAWMDGFKFAKGLVIKELSRMT